MSYNVNDNNCDYENDCGYDDKLNVITILSCVWLYPRLGEFWENARPFIPRLRLKKKKKEVEISSRKLIPLFFVPGSVHSGPAS